MQCSKRCVMLQLNHGCDNSRIMFETILSKPGSPISYGVAGRFDTGSPICLIDESIAKDLDLKVLGFAQLDRNGIKTKGYRYCTDVRLQGVLFEDVMMIGIEDLDIDFVIGMNIITQCTTTMYPSSKGLIVNIQRKMNLF